MPNNAEPAPERPDRPDDERPERPDAERAPQPGPEPPGPEPPRVGRTGPDRAARDRTRPEQPRRVRLERGGPVLVEGPVTVTGDDGVAVTSHRFAVALCTCRRSRSYPWCDTSHRRRTGTGQGPR